MTINKMITALNILKEKIGGEEKIPLVLVGFGENEYINADYPVIGDFKDQDGNKFKCAFIGCSGGEEFTRKDVPHYKWNPSEDKIKID